MKIKPKSAIGQNNLNFSRLIISKYAVFRNSASLPALIFRILSNGAVNNSLCSRYYNNHITVNNIGNSLNKFQKIYKIFNFNVVSSCDYSKRFKKQTSVLETPIPVYICSGVNFHREAVRTGGIKDAKSIFIHGKTGFDSDFKSRLINHTGFEKTLPGKLMKEKIQVMPVLNTPFSFTGNIQIKSNPMVSKIQKTFSFNFSDSEYDQTIENIEKTKNTSTNVDTFTKGKDLTHRISVNPVIFDYNHNKNFKTTGQTGEAKQTIGDSYASYFSVEETTTPVNPVMLRYLSRTFDLRARQVENKKDLSDKKVKYIAPIFEPATSRTIESLMFRQTRNKQDLQYEYNYDIQSKVRILVSAFQKKGVPQGSFDLSQDNVFSYPRPAFKYIQRFDKNNRLSETEADAIYDSKELIFKKNLIKNVGTIPENKSGLQSDETSSDRIYDDLAKEVEKEKMTHEIDFIADRVYKIIERRISIEKDRRGLF